MAMTNKGGSHIQGTLLDTAAIECRQQL